MGSTLYGGMDKDLVAKLAGEEQQGWLGRRRGGWVGGQGAAAVSGEMAWAAM